MASQSATSTGDMDLTLNPEFIRQVNLDNLRRNAKLKWVTIKKLYHTLSEYGLPYGGAVRDFIARTTAADSYYAYCKEHNINEEVNYDKLKVHRESFTYRNLLPNDIDIFITKKKFEELIKYLGENYILKKKTIANPTYFFKSCDLLKAALTHEKWDLCTFLRDDAIYILFGKVIPKQYFELSIDFVIINDDYLQNNEYVYRGILYPPFGNPDFDVNLLSFYIDDNNSLQITPLPYLQQLHSFQHAIIENPLQAYETNKLIMDSIITNIKSKKAFPVFPIKELYTSVFGYSKIAGINGYRLTKMLLKRYNIEFYNTILPLGVLSLWEKQYTENEETDASCSVCKKLFTNENRAFNACSKCPRKMHLICLASFLANAKPSNTQYDSISCFDCGQTPFAENCPCEIVNFLLKIIDYIDKPKSLSTRLDLDCKHWNTDCKCSALKCNLCKKVPSVPAESPSVPTDNQPDNQPDEQ